MVVKISLSRRTPVDKVALGRNIVTKMTGHPVFTDPTPSLADLTTALDELETAVIEAADGGRSKIAARREREKEAEELLRRLSLWVENISKGDPTLILSTGFDIKRAPVRAGTPERPLNLRTTLPGEHGIILLTWQPVKGAYTYEVQFQNGEQPNGPWTKLSTITRANFTVQQLTSGQPYWFRVAAVGTAGQSGWSDPALSYAP